MFAEDILADFLCQMPFHINGTLLIPYPEELSESLEEDSESLLELLGLLDLLALSACLPASAFVTGVLVLFSPVLLLFSAPAAIGAEFMTGAVCSFSGLQSKFSFSPLLV